MAQWKWAGFQVLEDWASGKDIRTVESVYEAMFEATDASDPGGPDAPGTLYLARIVDI